MEMFSLDLVKYGLEHQKKMQISDFTDDDINKLTNAFSAEMIAPRIPGISFQPNNVHYLLSLSKCRRCGRCCIKDKRTPDNPGVMVDDHDLITISKKTNHSLKSLNKITKINNNPIYQVGAKYLPLPCMFFNKNERVCKIYPFRPFICQIYPISDCPEGDITIDVQCDFGKDIFRKTLKHLRAKTKKTN